MFIRIQTGGTLNLNDGDYSEPFVAPAPDKKWHVFIKKDNPEPENEELNFSIASFSSVANANAALRSLVEAMKDELNIGWDAIEETERIEGNDLRSEDFKGEAV